MKGDKMTTAWGLRQAITVAINQSEAKNEGYTELYKRGWDDACAVILAQLKATYDREDPKPIG
jgi:hypothetical protein